MSLISVKDAGDGTLNGDQNWRSKHNHKSDNNVSAMGISIGFYQFEMNSFANNYRDASRGICKD